ncbi:MAG: glutamate--tRNA ligase [Rhodospirillales bacterium]|jgi:glutamyl-tRNA synthetase|nr:glutamate--tRNA ligase [Rhodospirillales bacterium]
MVKVRFAPSPTGLLHIGNARTALLNWLFARAHGGAYLLRFDDTDRERSRESYVEAARRDLRWLGLAWDEQARQSERLERYVEVADALRRSGRLYPCWETPEELEYKRNRQRARGLPPIYDRASLNLNEEEQAGLAAEGRRPYWRFLLKPGEVAWDDLIRGRVSFRGEHLSDPVVVRADGSFLYLLPSVIDDADLGISHVIRGEDHVTNTAVQLQMIAAIGAEAPRFAHLPLMTDIAGVKVSKRLGTTIALETVRSEGIEPMAINAYLASLGTGEAPRIGESLDEMAANFDIGRYGRAAPKFDPQQLEQLNMRVLHASPFEWVAGRLAAAGLGEADARFWSVVRENLSRLEDVQPWFDVCYGGVPPVHEDADLIRAAIAALPPEPWDDETWQRWTGAIGAATGRRGRALFMPLRQALTGQDHGPELKRLLPLIGRERVLSRLRGEGLSFAQGGASHVAPSGRR